MLWDSSFRCRERDAASGVKLSSTKEKPKQCIIIPEIRTVLCRLATLAKTPERPALRPSKACNVCHMTTVDILLICTFVAIRFVHEVRWANKMPQAILTTLQQDPP